MQVASSAAQPCSTNGLRCAQRDGCYPAAPTGQRKHKSGVITTFNGTRLCAGRFGSSGASEAAGPSSRMSAGGLFSHDTALSRASNAANSTSQLNAAPHGMATPTANPDLEAALDVSDSASASVPKSILNGEAEVKTNPARPPLSSLQLAKSVQAIVLAGGPSTNPLARHRAMPAVPFGCSFNLIDVPISCCVSSGLSKMYVLTQFNSHALNSHLTHSYPPLAFGHGGFVDVLACTQTPDNADWYRGSAEAVARNLETFLDPVLHPGDVPDDFVILSGQAVYNMDFAKIIAQHRRTGADVTMVTYCVGKAAAQRMGVVRTDAASGRVLNFAEKPTGESLRSFAGATRCTPEAPYEASLGVYVYRREALEALLAPAAADGLPPTHFGHDVLPAAISNGMAVHAYRHSGYWQDVSSLCDYFNASLSLASTNAPIRMHDVDNISIARRTAQLPPSIVHDCELERVLMGDGVTLRGCSLTNCVIGSRAHVSEGASLENVVMLGNDVFLSKADRAAAVAAGQPALGVGKNTTIRNAVIDINASVGANCRIVNTERVLEADREADGGYVISDGIVVVMQGAKIPDNTVI